MMRPLLIAGAAASVVLVSAISFAVGEQTIGNTSIVVRTVTGIFNENLRQLVLQDDIYHNERIETAGDSASELTFLDDTKLSLGPESQVTLDRFVFDPDPSKSEFVMSAAKGVMRFISGNLPKDKYVIHTPVSTIGIRGTQFLIVILSDGTTNITVEDDGIVEAFNCVGVQVNLDQPGLSTTITSRRDGTCSDPTIPGAQPPEFAAFVEGMDLTLLAGVQPGAGDPGQPDGGFDGPDEIQTFLEGPLGEVPSQTISPIIQFP